MIYRLLICDELKHGALMLRLRHFLMSGVYQAESLFAMPYTRWLPAIYGTILLARGCSRVFDAYV